MTQAISTVALGPDLQLWELRNPVSYYMPYDHVLLCVLARLACQFRPGQVLLVQFYSVEAP